jgi:hypothetical protein
MAKVSEVKFSNSAADLGKFHCVTFNLFDREEMADYAELRTEANNAASGIQIELMREYSRKTIIKEGGPEGIVTTQEDVFLVVHYWEKQPKRTKGESDEDDAEHAGLQSVPAGS